MQKDILDTDKIIPLLLRLSIPAMVGGFFSAFYGIADSIFVGRFIGMNALAALTISHSVQLIFISFAALFSVGSGVMISRSLGAKDTEQVKYIIVTSSYSVFLITFICSIIVVFFLKNILFLLGVTTEIFNEALIYMRMIVFFGFIVLLNGIFSGMLRAKGHAKFSMNMALLGSMLNVFLDIIFIVIIPWGVFGVAFATVFSQTIVFICSIYYLQSVFKINPFDMKYLAKNFDIVRQIILIGFPSGVRLLMIALSTLVTNRALAPYGVVALAAFGIVSRIFSLAFMPIQGCNFGTQPIVSYNFGAKRYDRLQNTLKSSLLLMIIISGIGTLLFFNAPTIWFKAFTTDEKIIIMAKESLTIIGSLFLCFGIYMLLSGFVQSVGYVKEALILSLVRPVIMILLLYILPLFWGLKGIWIVNPITDLSSFIIAIIITYRVYKKVMQQLKNDTITSVIVQGEENA